MKKLFLSLILLSSIPVYGQKTETVYSIAKEMREKSWYEGQIKAWKAEIDKNKKNGIAWTNYYMAARALRHLSYDNPEAQKNTTTCVIPSLPISKKQILPVSKLTTWRTLSRDLPVRQTT
jgi:hypothetical protein